ncbi:MAG: nicotinate (nicotinamide) nucleotide adenylyltransferase [Rhodoferax sp.]|nr:nicotinate (nicotinamide) nucleotide adenylyltransferase [Rhodoferax sp.]
MRHVGIFGGAFDPPHQGHIAVAQTALNQLQLDLLHVIPTGSAWHKERSLTGAEHRLEMARLAFSGLDRIVVDPREISRPGPTYTIDTLLELQRQYPGAQLYLIIGQDQAQALYTWYRWQELPAAAIICVAGRSVSGDAPEATTCASAAQIHSLTLNMPAVDVSATELRRRIAAHENVSPLVFESVARYIADHYLYQPA